MDTYLFVKVVHIISSCILLGTGIGIAFFMYRAKFTDNVHEKFYAARTTVLADFLFTLPAVIVQPVTGIWLVGKAGYNWTDFWLVSTYGLFVLIGLCWIPVVWIQIKLQTIVKQCLSERTPIPDRYHKLYRIWYLLGWPAFIGLIAIFYLMVAKPT